MIQIKQHVTCRYAVKLIASAEVKAHCPLRLRRLLASDGQAESSGERVDDVLEVAFIVDRSQQPGTSEELSLRLAESDVDVVDVVLLEETEDVLGGLVRHVAGCGVLLDADPNSNGTEHLGYGAIRNRPVPSKADEIDGGERDLSLMEEDADLGTNVSPQNSTLLEDHEPCHELRATDRPCPVWRDRRLGEASWGEGRFRDRWEA